MKKKILISLACILAVIAVICKIYYPEYEINNTISEVQNTITEEIQNIDEETTDIIVTEEAEEIVRDTIQATQER